MKASVTSITASHAGDRAAASVFADLIKARLTALVLVTTMVGFYVGAREGVNYLLMLNTLIGTGFLASGAAALNQLLERDLDAKMRRTENRPLPSGRMQPQTVLFIGGGFSAVGLVYLALAVNLLTSALGAITLVSYLFLYTPLKRITPLNTIIGAIPGALPPLMGWTAARGEVSIEGWALFAILFFWQLPHFLAIAWLYRDEYAKAGFAMLPVLDREGERTGRHAVSHTLGLLPVSLFPFVFKLAGLAYLLGATALGVAFIWFAIRFAREMSPLRARQLFFASIVYLPLLLGLMVLDKLG